jgi:hypothetical protein
MIIVQIIVCLMVAGLFGVVLWTLITMALAADNSVSCPKCKQHIGTCWLAECKHSFKNGEQIECVETHGYKAHYHPLCLNLHHEKIVKWQEAADLRREKWEADEKRRELEGLALNQTRDVLPGRYRK